MKDFFTRYRESRKHPYIMPAIIGLVFGFALVAEITNTPIHLGNIKANVLEANKEKVVYDADLIMERSSNNIIIRIGKDAQSVDVLSFSILGDPNIFTDLTTQDNDTTISSNERGIYLIKVTKGGALLAGDIVTTLVPKLSDEASLALIDAGFTSSGSTYSLSVKN